MTSTAAALPIRFSRRWLWPFICLSTGLAVTTPFALIFAAIVCFAISSPGGLGFADVIIASGAAIMVCLWLWSAWFTAMLLLRRNSPFLILQDNGVKIPHGRPSFITWDEIASVEQVRSGRVTYLRLQLTAPDEHLSRWQRIIKWPFSDSVLITLGADRSAAPDSAFLAVKARHAAHWND